MADRKPADDRASSHGAAGKPTYSDVQCALRSHCPDILSQFPVSSVQLSLPLDGKPPRIRVSVLPEDIGKIPASVELVIGRRRVAIPLEVADDYETFEAQ